MKKTLYGHFIFDFGIKQNIIYLTEKTGIKLNASHHIINSSYR